MSAAMLHLQATGGASLAQGSPGSGARAGSARAALDLLAYVHLRNIHGSTGAGRVARQLVEHLARRGDLRLQILADAADHARIVPLVGAPWDGFRYSLFARDTSRQQARWLAWGGPRAESFRPETEVIWCTAESYVPTRTARSVVTLHDAAYFEPGAHARNAAYWKQRLKWRLLYAKLARRVDLFHTVSQFSADRLAHFFPALAGRLRVVPNAVSPHFLLPATAEGQSYLRETRLDPSQTGEPVLLVPGGLHYRKNAELILAAAPELLRRFPALTIAVVNHSDPSYLGRAAGLGGRFRLLGFVSDPALRALYGAATAVWFPSRYEGFGLPVVEAMACGAPVVASRASSLPEIAGEAALLAAPDDGSAHLEAVSSLLADPGAAAEFSRRGRLRAAQFTWERSAALLAGHFHSLL